MKSIIRIIRKFTQNDVPTPLGRWKLDYCSKQLSNKVDLSNEDHCGSCSQYAITKTELNKTPISTDADIHPNTKV